MKIFSPAPPRFSCFVIFLIGYLSMSCLCTYAQTARGDSAVSGWGVYPIIFYTDQTSLAMGGHAVHYFKGQGDAHTSTINTDLIYTLKKQLILGGDTEIYKPNYRINAAIWYQKFPDIFYGIGNDSKSDNMENFTVETVEISMRLPYGLSEHLFAGVLFDGQYQDCKELVSGGILENSLLPGLEKPYWLTGTGLLCEWDSRDQVYYPTRGAYLRLWSIFYLPMFGSSYKLNLYRVDMRKYFAPSERMVLAFQAYLSTVEGNVPFASYQILGTTSFRGFSARYRDKTLLTFQGEIRMKFWSRFGFVAFAGVGEVSPDLESLGINAFKIGAGLGIRFQAIPETGLNIRLDFGVGSDNNSSLTFYPGEAY